MLVNIYACMHASVCAWVCVCVLMYVVMCVCVCARAHSICLDIFICIYMRRLVYRYLSVGMHACVCMYLY